MLKYGGIDTISKEVFQPATFIDQFTMFEKGYYFEKLTSEKKLGSFYRTGRCYRIKFLLYGCYDLCMCVLTRMYKVLLHFEYSITIDSL